ncbi:MAG: hypothetical protein H6839_14135 [Planctomycetes bacterium]|nr:hypothetical protein [Planctomycetota bacterium]
MQTRFFVAALAMLGAIVLAAVWQLNTEPRHSKPIKPRQFAGANIDEPLQGGRALTPDASDVPILDDVEVQRDSAEAKPVIAPPPPAPLVENDPAKGKIWLRLLDSRSNRPLADADCALWRLPYNEGWYQREVVGRRTADRDGLVGLSVGVVDADDEEDFSDDYNNAVWDVCLFYELVDWFSYPVPRGWQPVTPIDKLAESIGALKVADNNAPIDVLLAPSSTLRITARDEWGAPLPDAELEVRVISTGDSQELWYWMDEAPIDDLSLGNWNQETDLFRRNHTRDGVICTLSEEPEPDFEPRIDSTVEWQPVRGSVFLKDLPQLSIGAMAWDPTFGFGQATVQLVPGSNELNVYLRPVASSTVKLRIEWLDDEPAALQQPYLQIHNVGPLGRNEGIEDNDERIDCSWDLKRSETGVWVGEIRNLPPGYWWLEAGLGSSYSGTAHFQLLPLETRSVTLYAGAKSGAHWKPIIQSGGVQLENSSLRILGGGETTPVEYSIYHDPESGETDVLDLSAGSYTIWIPTLQPFELTLGPGETRSDVYELLSTSIRFAIDANLAELLSRESSEVMLNLYPQDGWSDAEDHLHALDARLRKRDEKYDILSPGVTRSWMVPPGKYYWELAGDDESLEGHIEITPTGPTSVTFGLNSLPGRVMLEIDLSGFGDDERVELSFSSDPMADTAINAMRRYDWDEINTGVSDVIGDEYGPQILRSADGKRAYAFSPPGMRHLSVYAREASGWFCVRFPGRMTIGPYDLQEKPEGELILTTHGDEDEPERDNIYFHVLAYHESGDTGEYDGEDVIAMPLGKVTLMVTRDDYEERQDAANRFSFATVQATITRESQKIRLDTLNFRRYGRVSLTFKGRGAPDSPFDPWWFNEEGPEMPLILALDQQIGGMPRYVRLEHPDRYMPDGAMAFVYDNRVLPPGRYKVIPWRGAAEKWCVTFEVKPGEATSVVVQGGK